MYASELGSDRVKKLQAEVLASGLTQMMVVDGHSDTTQFPDARCDALFMRDVCHHLSSPARMNPTILAAVKAGARVAIVDFRPPGQEALSPADRARDGMHGIYPETIVHEMKSAGFELGVHRAKRSLVPDSLRDGRMACQPKLVASLLAAHLRSPEFTASFGGQPSREE